MSPSSHSITQWIESLRNNEPRAQSELWQRFCERMLSVARARLANAPRRVADEEDVVVQAFASFLTGVQAGRFPRLDDRDDLWAVLFTLTERIAAKQRRDLGRDKRGGGQVGGDSVLAGVDPQAESLSPVETVVLQDEMHRLLAALPDDELRRIALARLEGYSNAEIARQIDRAEVTVERRMRMIRLTWRKLGMEA